ncbi:hypothetical protein [Thioalkalivibrio sp.]|uniref:hypothetical protein n=1 Tax=Thioalkalivibrio sp. TaxID=2093813 RepID=UPI003563B72E
MSQSRGTAGERVAPVSGKTSEPRMARAPRSRLSMHEGVTVWCDCCSCEAEPYWAEVAGELGVDLDPAGERDGE